jgi:fermentation-respiration switch protein FrsA (DUF1100 family)
MRNLRKKRVQGPLLTFAGVCIAIGIVLFVLFYVLRAVVASGSPSFTHRWSYVSLSAGAWLIWLAAMPGDKMLLRGFLLASAAVLTGISCVQMENFIDHARRVFDEHPASAAVWLRAITSAFNVPASILEWPLRKGGVR